MAYDARGNVIKVTDALNHSSSSTYDILNRITKSTSALGHERKYQYDLLNRTTQATSAEGRVTKYAYDANSNLLSVTDPAGNMTRYDYDRKDRLIKRTDASGKVAIYQYDGNDNLVKNTDRKGQVTTYQYDANDRLISTTYNDGKSVSNTYDDEDRLVSLNDTAPGAGQHNFTYDILDRLTQETNPRGTVNYAYDVLGRRTSLKINNQRTMNYSYDNNNRLTAITEGNETFGFSYDPLDRRAGMTLPNGISTAYSYDPAGRLTGMKYSKGSTVLRDLSYGYDEINRRTSYSGNTAPAPRDTATDTATVNALNQYTAINGQAVAHDENGNQTINRAVWDARDRLVSLTGSNFTASFTYDAMGRRTSKIVNGQKKTYLYDGSDLISETGAEYTFGPGIDQPLERKSGQNEYYLSDALGSVIGLADGTGAIKTSYNYSPFGKKQTTGTNSSNPFAFTGREDDGTGYYYYRARYYSPDQKRFIAEDPLEFGGGDTNFYTYVGGNPVNFTDPSGLRSPELTSLLQTACAKKIKQACEDYPQAPSYSQALANAEAEFYNIADKSTIEVRPSEKFGYIETGNLLGGGKCVLRPGGSSGFMPTIDLQEDGRIGHNTPGYEKVGEIKFKYRGNESNAIQTKIIPTPSETPSTPLERLGNFLQNLVAPFIPSKKDINRGAY
jgi:RHS repeat-associated protein